MDSYNIATCLVSLFNFDYFILYIVLIDHGFIQYLLLHVKEAVILVYYWNSENTIKTTTVKVPKCYMLSKICLKGIT